AFELIVMRFGFIPVELVESVEVTPYLPASPYLTAFTSMFMHGGWLHLIGNMLFMWIYGNNVEDYLGHIKFLLFYLASGLAAVALYTVFSPHSEIPLVGASGAIAGLMGAYMVLHPKARITILIIFFFIQFVTLPAKVVLGIWFALQLLMSLSEGLSGVGGGGVAWMAHVGGFVFGWIILKLATMIFGKHGQSSGGQRVYKMDWQ
ncbi:MAG TPA: rhomboid family intramembrane serine protease, partial [candidate division Zixibacteria bacterium]|nr:rhomboid family intramembrane serine protease [candidate division Zixibacteria bacterium]